MPRPARQLAIGSQVMLWYLRALGVVYFVSGLGHWAFIIGITGEGFADEVTHIQAATIYFALIEVVAATGLWAGAAWGVAAWLFAAVAGIVIHVGFADLFGSNWIVVGFHLFTISAYAGLAWWTGASETSGDTFRLPPD